mmetsp:Transcript_113098/g.351092  ORF Transcript_113098/g.351092 Transcript_113098/m.351092 type:complete len:352 (+) Transcript_113098:50-1105(+)
MAPLAGLGDWPPWAAPLSGGSVLALVASVLLPAAIALVLLRGPGKAGRRPPAAGATVRADRPRRTRGANQEANDLPGLTSEPWFPKMELRDWQQAAELAGCPWSFGGCTSLEDVLGRIWLTAPLVEDLKDAFEALQAKVKGVQIARVRVESPPELYFAVVYTLATGAELFGGEPVEPPAITEPGGETNDLTTSQGTRRRGSGSAQRAAAGGGLDAELPPPSLAPFYRVHDGFGVLLSTQHLPFLLRSPGDALQGSCFYVNPIRGLEPVASRQSLVRFARVDCNCVACTERWERFSRVVYMEKSGEQVEEEEAPLAFVGDTVSNLAGQRVVPPSYLGGPGAFGVSPCEGAWA